MSSTHRQTDQIEPRAVERRERSLRGLRLVLVALVPALALAFAGRGALEADPEPDGASQPRPATGPLRGVTVSCRGWGRAWAGPEMAGTLTELRELGATAMSIHPYAWIRNDGAIRHRAVTDDPTVLRPLAEARERGLTVLLKPHIGYWGSRFSWRGAIAFEDPTDTARFFAGYKDFIVHQARLAEKGGAAWLSIGCETKALIGEESAWRAIIKDVREVYSGKLTYAANWDSYRRVPFWDALDAIGIQAYFPLTDKVNPDRAALEAGWAKLWPTLDAFAKTTGKPLLFTELGYNRSSQAAAKPWEHAEGGPNAAELKLRCMAVALDQTRSRKGLVGVFLWKWFPGKRSSSRNFVLQYPAMKTVLREAWKAPKTSPADETPSDETPSTEPDKRPN